VRGDQAKKTGIVSDCAQKSENSQCEFFNSGLANMSMKTLHLRISVLSCWLAAGLFASPLALGQVANLRDSVAKGLATNPEVTARLNAYKASVDAVAVGSGGWKPRVDLSANVGRDQTSLSNRSPESQSLNRNGIDLSLVQLLWDGSGTSSEVERLGHERLSRYFELVDASEQTALEVARAYYDVLRFRRLVQLAEDNYVQHKHGWLQVQSRVKAGVGRGVDLEQVDARLALAESNLATEQANLHDVTARYQRLVGEPAPPRLSTLEAETAVLKEAIPAKAADALQVAMLRSGGVSAAIEGMRAARAAVSSKESVYQPRVEARLRTGVGHNFYSVASQNSTSSAELVLNWNLYNGNADQARIRQQVGLLNQATDLRDKACRDVRQTTAIAFNDTRKLVEQLGYLERNEVAIAKARDAYRQQFDIGQRSLLDVLNAENELYTARRSNVNAQHDLGISYARTHAAMNQLLARFGFAKPLADSSEAEGWSAGEDGPGRCPVEALELATSDRTALDAKAQSLSVKSPVVAPMGGKSGSK
jgi:adhesin transport system outer membrane protein